MPKPRLKAPFPWFGGKSRAVGVIHPRLGDCPAYIEPFAGSLAYLLSKAPSRYETVNDLDNYVANFWRAVTADPEAVAFHADWPVNEACLTARHRWLMAAWRKHKFRTRMLCDPTYFDALVAGWWVWGISCWIGAGWCDERSEWNGPGGEGNRGRAMHQPKEPDAKRQNLARQFAVHKVTVREPSPTPEMMVQSERGPAGVRRVPTQRPACSHESKGVTKSPDLMAKASGVRPDLASDGKGVHAPHRKRPCLGDGHTMKGCVPMGRPHLQRHYEVHKPPKTRSVGEKLPAIAEWKMTSGLHKPNCALLEWMNRLADRLRYVRVCCGDWSRIMGKAVRTAATPCAILLDPPYSDKAGRAENIYATEDLDVAHDVREWCVEHGGDESLRIALCGYEGEGHEVLVNDHGWTVEAWKASGGYGRIHGDKAGRSLKNRHRERIYFSPGCIPAGNALPPGATLFAAAGGGVGAR